VHVFLETLLPAPKAIHARRCSIQPCCVPRAVLALDVAPGTTEGVCGSAGGLARFSADLREVRATALLLDSCLVGGVL
jgi:hypothetical protein